MNEEIDILLYVALSEEFHTVTEVLGEGFTARELGEIALTGYFGSIHSDLQKRSFSVAAFPAGKMGNTRSATLTSALIEKFKPRDVVILGIAGSLSNDLEPGDVFIPDSINEYLANSATAGGGKNWIFKTSGIHFNSSARLLNRFSQFPIVHKTAFDRWRKNAAARRARDVPPDVVRRLAAAGIVLRDHCAVLSGDDRKLASGPAVGKGEAFVKWIKGEVDRKVAALEMESAGVHDASFVRVLPPRTIAIRGISDFADARKEKLDDIGKGVFRQLSMHNACSLFKAGVEAGLFAQDVVISDSDGSGRTAEIEQSRIKSVLIIGGVSEETDDVDGETPRLFKAAFKLGDTIARAGAQLVACSPLPDSADYYASMGYADAKVGGVIHFHAPVHPTIKNKLDLFENRYGHSTLAIQRWNYPEPESDDKGAWSQAWLFAQLQALERADAVVALGGRISHNAQTVLHLAEARGIPLVPYSFLGGAAQRAFRRRNWKVNHPRIDERILTEDAGVSEVIHLANQLVIDRARRLISPQQIPKTVFVSYAHQDAPAAHALISILKKRDVEVLVGDEQIRSGEHVSTSIEKAVLRSDVCAVLWSRNYAQSPWCYDELDLAINRQENKQSGLWLFNLDNSNIVPARARNLPFLSVANPAAFESLVAEMMPTSD